MTYTIQVQGQSVADRTLQLQPQSPAPAARQSTILHSATPAGQTLRTKR